MMSICHGIDLFLGKDSLYVELPQCKMSVEGLPCVIGVTQFACMRFSDSVHPVDQACLPCFHLQASDSEGFSEVAIGVYDVYFLLNFMRHLLSLALLTPGGKELYLGELPLIDTLLFPGLSRGALLSCVC